MDKMQNARLDLFNMMHGRIIPNSVMADIRYDAGDDLFDKFRKIYEDPKQKYLLIANDTTLSGYQAFWNEIFPEDGLDLSALEFLQSRDFAEVKFCWKDELTNFIRNEANVCKRPYLAQLADALYVTHTKLDLSQVLGDMLKKQVDVSADYDVYWGFCLVAFSFDLMSEDLLPLLYQALEKHNGLLVALG